MLESRLPASLHKHVRTGCSDTPSEAQIRLETLEERKRKRERKRERERVCVCVCESENPPLFLSNRLFLMFKCGERLHSDELAFVVMIAQ